MGNSWNRFSFTGYEEDTESGLLYAKARFYDPDIGRFLSHDAWEGDQTLPPSLHKYLYAYQNPTAYVDPTGNIVCGGLCVGGIILIAGAVADYFYDMDEAREDINNAIRSTEPKSGIGKGLAASGEAVTTLVTGTLGFLPAVGEQTGEFFANEERTLADAPILGQVGTHLAESTAEFVSNPSIESGVQLWGATGEAFLTTVAPVSGRNKATIAKENPSGPSAVVRAESQSLQKISENISENKKLHKKISEAGVSDAIKQNAKQAVRKTRIEKNNGNSSLNNPRSFGTESHLKFERENNKLANRVAGTKEISVEEFRGRTGARVRRRQLGSVGADVIIRDKSTGIIDKIFDLKTYTKKPTKIGRARQAKFRTRFGKPAEEIFEGQ